jgi:hypothetical protein
MPFGIINNKYQRLHVAPALLFSCRFFFGRCDQCYFLEIRLPAFFRQTRPDSFFEFRQQSDSQLQTQPDSFCGIPQVTHFL